MGFTNDEITVDVAVCLTKFERGAPVSDSIMNYVHARAIKFSYGGFNSITAEERAAMGVNFRFYFQELDKTCGNSHLLDFDGDYTWCLQEAGRQDAQMALEIGQELILYLMEIWEADNSLQLKYPYVYDYILVASGNVDA